MITYQKDKNYIEMLTFIYLKNFLSLSQKEWMNYIMNFKETRNSLSIEERLTHRQGKMLNPNRRGLVVIVKNHNIKEGRQTCKIFLGCTFLTATELRFIFC